MAFAYPEVRAFKGLYLGPNSFGVPEGSFEIAKNVVLREQNVVSKTRGFYTYWKPLPGHTLGELLATATYRAANIPYEVSPGVTTSEEGSVIGIFSGGLGYFTSDYQYGEPNVLGELVEIDANYSFTKPISIETDDGLFITSDSALLKLEGETDPKVFRAGIDPGLGLRLQTYAVVQPPAGVLVPNSVTAYRVAFGRRTANGKELISAPSDILAVAVRDISVAYSYSVVSNEVILEADPSLYPELTTGSTILVSGATGTYADQINGHHTVTSGPFSPKIRFSVTGVPDAAVTGPILKISYFVSPTLVYQIPAGFQESEGDYFVQIHRSQPVVGPPGNVNLGQNADPEVDFALIEEKTLTLDEIRARMGFFTDTVSTQIARGEQLYTNENTREGELQANYPPPLARFMAFFKQYLVLGGVTTYEQMVLNMVDIAALTDVVFRIGGDDETYIYNSFSDEGIYRTAASGTGVIEIVSTFTLPVNAVVRIIAVEGGTLQPGDYNVSSSSGSSFLILSGSDTATFVTWQFIGYRNGSKVDAVFGGYIGPMDNLTTTSGLIQHTTQELVRAINLHSQHLYANYVSGTSGLPGQIIIRSKLPGVKFQIKSQAGVFVQDVPASFSSGNQYQSSSDSDPNMIYVSKAGEHEAFPLTNFEVVGAKSSDLVYLESLEDSLVILREDGVFRITGDVLSQFSQRRSDSTVRFYPGMLKPAGNINNSIYAFSDQGIMEITENSEQIASMALQRAFDPIMNRDLTNTYLYGHESDRLFYVQTLLPGVGAGLVTWTLNIIDNSWTQLDQSFYHMAEGRRSELMVVMDDGRLMRQRRDHTRIDFCGEFATATALRYEAYISLHMPDDRGIKPEPGDIILWENIPHKIAKAGDSGPYFYVELTPSIALPLLENKTVTLYKAIESVVKFAPFHAGQMGRGKVFSFMQLHFRSDAVTEVDIRYATHYQIGTQTVHWDNYLVPVSGQTGFGFAPFGLSDWGDPIEGDAPGLDIATGTDQAVPLRTTVPSYANRSTFIQPIIRHKVAGEPMLIQSLSFAVHGYGERIK